MRYLEAVLDDEPLLSDHLLRLAEWMAQYYLAPLGEVLRGMLPLMAEVRRTVYYRITDLGRMCWRSVWIRRSQNRGLGKLGRIVPQGLKPRMVWLSDVRAEARTLHAEAQFIH